MSQLSRPLSAHPVRLLALAGALLLAALIALPAPAQAHDTLLSTDPEDGATLETSPEEVTFTFSADILDVSPLVRISDDDGEEVAEIVPTCAGPHPSPRRSPRPPARGPAASLSAPLPCPARPPRPPPRRSPSPSPPTSSTSARWCGSATTTRRRSPRSSRLSTAPPPPPLWR